jgi:transcriptional regulator with XRE-family HTH domain
LYLPENIAYLRKRNKMTQRELSNRMLVTRSTVSKWESGTYEPEINSLKRLSEVFDTSIDDLIFINLEKKDQLSQSN